MAKDPAFLFYTGDFTTGTQFFTDEQVGKYVRLLMAQHQLGHLEEKHMLLICKTYDKDVFSKFTKDSNGLYYNERLENEIVKRKKYSESRSENRKKKNDISETYVPHMENKNKNILLNTLTISNTSWETEKTLFINAEEWQMKQCAEFKLSRDRMIEYVNEFLKEQDAKEDYKDVKELKKHWYGWYKKNKLNKSNGFQQTELSDYQKKLLADREMFKNKTA